MIAARAAAAMLAAGALMGAAGMAAAPCSPAVRAVPLPGPIARATTAGAVVARSFDELVALVDDPNGPRAIELLSATYRGDLAVKRSVAIRGAKGAALEGSRTGTVVTIDASDVVLENVVIRGSGRRHTVEDAAVRASGDRVRIAHVRVEQALFGISLRACHACTIDAAHVVGGDGDDALRGDALKLWESNDSVVTNCAVERSRDVVVWYTRRATIDDLRVTGSRYGVHFMYAHDSVVRRSRFEKNTVGVFIMYSARMHVEDNVLAGARGAAGMGLGFKDSDAVTVSGNAIVANTMGTYLDNTPRTPSEPVEFHGNVFALNDVALGIHSAERGIAFRGNDFGHNVSMIAVDGGGDALGVEMSGNHYADYEGYDLDGDGIGDVPYEVRALSSDLKDARPSLAFFNGTAAMGVIDAVARAMPVFASRRLLVDGAPLVDAPGVASASKGGSL